MENKNTDAFARDKDLFVLVKNLDTEEVSSFMQEVYELETSFSVSPPPRGYGEYIAKVTYANGDVEMLGTVHIEYIEYGAEPTGVGAYYFKGDTIEQLIMKYAGLLDRG